MVGAVPRVVTRQVISHTFRKGSYAVRPRSAGWIRAEPWAANLWIMAPTEQHTRCSLNPRFTGLELDAHASSNADAGTKPQAGSHFSILMTLSFKGQDTRLSHEQCWVQVPPGSPFFSRSCSPIAETRRRERRECRCNSCHEHQSRRKWHRA